MNEEIIARAAEFIAPTKNCVLALIDADGYPTAATITPSKTEGIQTIFFGNNINSNWAKRAAQCNRASICFSADHPECNITLVGIIDVITDDPAIKKEMWHNWMEMYYSGPDDPAYCVLRFKTRRYSLYVDGTQARGTIDNMFRLGIIEESLENFGTLSILKPFFFSQRIADVPDDEYPIWHINEYHVPDRKMTELLPVLEKQVKSTWYIHAFSEDKLIVILPGRSFHIAPRRDATWDEMIEYGLSVGVGRDYLENIPLNI